MGDKQTAHNAMNTTSYVSQTDVAKAIAKSDGVDWNKLDGEHRRDYENRAYNAANSVDGVERKGGSRYRRSK